MFPVSTLDVGHSNVYKNVTPPIHAMNGNSFYVNVQNETIVDPLARPAMPHAQNQLLEELRKCDKLVQLDWRYAQMVAGASKMPMNMIWVARNQDEPVSDTDLAAFKDLAWNEFVKRRYLASVPGTSTVRETASSMLEIVRDMNLQRRRFQIMGLHEQVEASEVHLILHLCQAGILRTDRYRTTANRFRRHEKLYEAFGLAVGAFVCASAPFTLGAATTRYERDLQYEYKKNTTALFVYALQQNGQTAGSELEEDYVARIARLIVVWPDDEGKERRIGFAKSNKKDDSGDSDMVLNSVAIAQGQADKAYENTIELGEQMKRMEAVLNDRVKGASDDLKSRVANADALFQERLKTQESNLRAFFLEQIRSNGSQIQGSVSGAYDGMKEDVLGQCKEWFGKEMDKKVSGWYDNMEHIFGASEDGDVVQKIKEWKLQTDESILLGKKETEKTKGEIEHQAEILDGIQSVERLNAKSFKEIRDAILEQTGLNEEVRNSELKQNQRLNDLERRMAVVEGQVPVNGDVSERSNGSLKELPGRMQKIENGMKQIEDGLQKKDDAMEDVLQHTAQNIKEEIWAEVDKKLSATLDNVKRIVQDIPKAVPVLHQYFPDPEIEHINGHNTTTGTTNGTSESQEDKETLQQMYDTLQSLLKQLGGIRDTLLADKTRNAEQFDVANNEISALKKQNNEQKSVFVDLKEKMTVLEDALRQTDERLRQEFQLELDSRDERIRERMESALHGRDDGVDVGSNKEIYERWAEPRDGGADGKKRPRSAGTSAVEPDVSVDVVRTAVDECIRRSGLKEEILRQTKRMIDTVLLLAPKPEDRPAAQVLPSVAQGPPAAQSPPGVAQVLPQAPPAAQDHVTTTEIERRVERLERVLYGITTGGENVFADFDQNIMDVEQNMPRGDFGESTVGPLGRPGSAPPPRRPVTPGSPPRPYSARGRRGRGRGTP